MTFRWLGLVFWIAIAPSLGFAQGVPLIEPGTSLTLFANGGDATPPFETLLEVGGGYVELTSPIRGKRAEAFTNLTLGALGKTISAFGALDALFEVTGAEPTSLDATVSMTVEWDGIVYLEAGLGQAGGSVTIAAQLLGPNDNVLAQVEVLNEDLSKLTVPVVELSAGANRIMGTKEVAFSGKVTRGQPHTVRLKVECETTSGLLGANQGCDFASTVSFIERQFPNAPVPQDRFVTWDELRITIAEDIVERLDEISETLDQVNRKLDETYRLLRSHDRRMR